MLPKLRSLWIVLVGIRGCTMEPDHHTARFCIKQLVMHVAPILSLWLMADYARAAPANDAYASALVLPAALPVEASGTTVGATLEAQETFPAIGGKTVWWTWTPAVSGWVQLTVVENVLDPVVSVFGGASATLSDRLAWNDDASSGLAASTSSEVIFPAIGGRLYHIQVGGFGGSEGPISLKLQAVATPPQLTALSFQPVEVDVTALPGVAVVTVGIAHPAGFTGGTISLYRPDGVEEVLRTFGSGERISGSASAGTYQISLPIRQKVLPGPFAMRVQVSGSDGSKTVYGERTPFPDALPTSIPVVNRGIIDSAAPTVVSLALSSAVADVTTVEQTVAVTVRLADLDSGIIDFSSSLEVRTPMGETFFGDLKGAESNTFSRRNRTTGNGFDGTYTISVIVPAGAPPGDYPLAFHLVDSLGNRIGYGPASAYGEVPLPPPFPTHLKVVNTGTVDQTPPVLTGVTLTPATVNVAEFQSFVLTVRATDARSGTTSVALSGAVSGLQPVAGGAVVPIQDNLLRSSGTPMNGVYTTTITPSYTLAPGTYRVVGITLTDALENERSYGPAGLGLTNFPSGINPLVTITNQPLPGPYQTWLAGYPSLTGAQAARTADPDGDNLPNLIELVLGTNPTLPNVPGSSDPNQANVPVFRRVGNRLYMDYKLTSANLGTGPRTISVDAQSSSDLRSWDSAIRLIGETGFSAYITVTPGEKNWIRLMAYDPAADLGG